MCASPFVQGRVWSKGHQLCPHPLRLWLRCVNDTFIIQQAEHSHQFLQYINSIDPHIQLNTEHLKDDGSISFPGTLVSLGPSNTLITSVYRKPTHTGQYLQWDSNQTSPAKYSVYITLAHRTRVVCTSQSGLKQEENHIKQALLRCNYPPWAVKRLHTKINTRLVPTSPTFQTADNKPTTTMAKPKAITLS